MRYNGPRFDFETLRVQQGWHDIGQAVTRLHVPRRSIEMYQKTGMTVGAADRAATRLGVPPNTIWPNFYDDIVIALIRYALGRVAADLRERGDVRDRAGELLNVLAMCDRPVCEPAPVREGVGVSV